MVVEIVFKASTPQLQASRTLICATTALLEKCPRRLETTKRRIVTHAYKEHTWTKRESKSARIAHR
jgi:hypothetical protein